MMKANSSVLKWCIDGAKVTGAALTILGVAWGVGVFDLSGQVPDAEADIIDFFFSPKNNSHIFAEALKSRGHGDPQIYDLNGNTIFFSVNYSDRAPRSVLREYQDEFVSRGLNDQAYYDLDPEKADARFLTGMTGGVVPQVIGNDYIAMGGVLTQNEAKGVDDILREFHPGKNEAQLFKAHRWIEIFHEPNSDRTAIVSSWSDEEFAYDKMIPNAQGVTDQSVDLEIPSCPGCTRINRFADIGQQPSPHQTNIFETTHSVSQMSHFYEWAMGGRGWTKTSESGTMDAVQNALTYDGDDMEVLDFERDGRTLKVLVHSSPDQRTTVHTILSQGEDRGVHMKRKK